VVRIAGVVVARGGFAPAAGDRELTVMVTRADLRPLPGVAVPLAGAVNRESVTDGDERAAFPAAPGRRGHDHAVAFRVSI
jgi:hypothetical protein